MKEIGILFLCLLLGDFVEAQCFKNRHNTSWNESWVSCETKENPNIERGQSHWILYDFGHTYRLGSTHMWNINAPDMLENGFRDFYIDYSTDGNIWKSLGLFNLEQASGTSTYEGIELTSFSGDTARYVLFTSLSNWGGECSGIAEAKFEVIELVSRLHVYEQEDCLEVAVYPNPHKEAFNLSIRPSCLGHINYSFYDHTGKQVYSNRFDSDETTFTTEINTGNLSPGLYHLIIRQARRISRYPVMKIK